eukprot:gnl/Spiro4/18761_TR10028_c0_g2_i1.p1 gnl/Spiro4/18761_TR10028_c0_g2~~gnl/Spiro4/18761_TR10028_c0_g2_i1.p1  ORF type:complete len:400 (-),score=94.29 gnl/Spiro4/18761_TR10028_c0_g2_i1:62-1261(-)
MRVVFFVHSLGRNGANIFVLLLARQLLAHIVNVAVVSPSEGDLLQELVNSGCSVHICAAVASGLPADPGLLDVLQAERGRDDVVVLVNTLMVAHVAVACCAVDLPCVLIVHEGWPLDQIQRFLSDVFLSKVTADTVRQAFACAPRIVFPSLAQCDLYRELIPRGNECTIYNGIAAPAGPPSACDRTARRAHARSSLGYRESDFVMLHIGTVCPRKGQLLSVRALAALVARGCTGAQLLIVGARYLRTFEVEYLSTVRREAARLGVTARLRLLDTCAEVDLFYDCADIVLVPSLNEVLPLVVCEAMAHALPVVASAICGIPEALCHGCEGFLVEPNNVDELGDCAFALYAQPSLRARCGLAGVARVASQFQVGEMGARYLQVLRSVLKTRNRSGRNGGIS